MSKLIDAVSLMDTIRRLNYPVSQGSSVDEGMTTLGIQHVVDDMPDMSKSTPLLVKSIPHDLLEKLLSQSEIIISPIDSNITDLSTNGTSEWEEYDSTGTNNPDRYRCKKCHCISINDSRYCPDCGSFMTNHNVDLYEIIDKKRQEEDSSYTD